MILKSKDKGIPWVEKYRPTNFHDIVLSKLNKRILTNVLKLNHFPNFLFYGPPGTGKTTTIINLIREYQNLNGNKHKNLIIHLNASDERGIDTIRNQIYHFAKAKPLFTNGMKFIILDEVDYMTKNAQQALKHIVQSYNNNVRFCLICNYISKIDMSLQNEFIRLRFNQLPEAEIVSYLDKIIQSENMTIDNESLKHIQHFYHSDLRSMINTLQLHQHNNDFAMVHILSDDVIEDIVNNIFDVNIDFNEVNERFNTSMKTYNVSGSHIINHIINYIIRYKTCELSHEMLNMFAFCVHTYADDSSLSHFFLLKLISFVRTD